ncbi:MAG: glycosyltransferase family 2 protein [Tildeniella nuda ZEHNDER 1965/U140]|jgi:glycosyltransferase involved in cell wall biosynthesis|nr:glycosyltransferase family 2 protein [Tildeniella nuda ZEHNDER 1965/U140]
MKLLSVIILTKDEAINLKTCLKSLQSLDAEIYIVDSGSTDATLEIAAEAGCKIYTNAWVNHAHQLNWAIANLPITTLWTMRVDADEHLTPELVQEILQVLPTTSKAVTAYQMKRRVYFMGKWIRHGGRYPSWLLRIWRTGMGHCEQRWMDEHIIISDGKIADLKHDIIDENQKGLTFWVDKHNRYADREISDLLADDPTLDSQLLDAEYSTQASQVRWAKKNFYNRSPLFIRAVVYFLFRYFIRLGFLDGWEGLSFHVLQGFWYRFLVDAKLYELRLKDKRLP